VLCFEAAKGVGICGKCYIIAWDDRDRESVSASEFDEGATIIQSSQWSAAGLPFDVSSIQSRMTFGTFGAAGSSHELDHGSCRMTSSSLELTTCETKVVLLAVYSPSSTIHLSSRRIRLANDNCASPPFLPRSRYLPLLPRLIDNTLPHSGHRATQLTLFSRSIDNWEQHLATQHT